jgi:Flavocytochrome c sulphide dehydrogenase, flavin-binding
MRAPNRIRDANVRHSRLPASMRRWTDSSRKSKVLGVSPADAPSSTRVQEAELANGWFKTITDEVFG